MSRQKVTQRGAFTLAIRPGHALLALAVVHLLAVIHDGGLHAELATTVHEAWVLCISEGARHKSAYGAWKL